MKIIQIEDTNKYGEAKLHTGLADSVPLLDENPIVITKKLENLSSRLSNLSFGHQIKKQAA